MTELTGKTIVTTDWHFGNRNDSPKFHKILSDAIREINAYARENHVENMLFCGDLFHKRNTISVDTISVATRCMESVSRTFRNVYIILGNHDLFNKSNSDVYSPIMFKSMKNVHIVSEGEVFMLNGRRCLMSPWLCDISSYEKDSFDMIFGHFDISENYMRACRSMNNRRRNMTDGELAAEIESDTLLLDDTEDMNFENENTQETYVENKKSSELIGNWTDTVRDGGTIFAGHIHRRSEFYTNGRKFIFIGSPYQQNRGEMDSEDGMYVIDEDGSHRFVGLTYPEHVDVRMSDIVKDVEGFDFSSLKGKIIHKIYDMDVDNETDSSITRRINDVRPYEELPPDYMKTKGPDGSELSTDTIDSLRKSTMEYIRNYVNGMDDGLFENRRVTKDRLIEVAESIYEMTGGLY